MKNSLLAVVLLICVGFHSEAKASIELIFTSGEGAINGFDPVAYFTESKPVKGQAEISLDWNGATWHFATKENRDLFSENPENYAPKFGGYCAYAWSGQEGHAVPSDPQAWSVVDGNLYLNYNLDVQKMWKENQAEYIQVAGINYASAFPILQIQSQVTTMEDQRPPLPPFTEETAKQKIQMAEDAWNSKDPERVSRAYTVDSEWRNRNVFINGREEIVKFLTAKWQKEQEYKLKKEYWAHTGNRIAVRFEYEYHDENGQWFRAYGNENWEFDENGFMAKRYASINDLAIEEKDRKFR